MSESIFQDKTVVITGASGALCSVIAQDLAQRGGRVALLGRTAAPLEALAAKIRAAGGAVLAISADVTDPASVEAARRRIAAQWEPCHYLINGAGGNAPEGTTSTVEFDPREVADDRPPSLCGFFNLTHEGFERVLNVNTLGTVIPCQVFGREMAQHRRGAILNFASMTTFRPITRTPAYGMAKAAIANFTQWLAVYLAPAGIRVNALAPGFFINERSRKLLMTEDGGLSSRGESVVRHTAQKRLGQPEDLLGAVRWLLDDQAAAFVTGITVPVDGGFLASSGV